MADLYEGELTMKRYLPGNVSERLIELRESKKLSQEAIAKIIGCDRVTYGRMEKGQASLDSEELVALSNFYDLPTDYILGLVDSPEKTYYEIRELGLSVEAAERLYSGKVDPRVVNELLLNDNFVKAVNRMAIYFSDSMAGAIRTSNRIMDFTSDYLEEMISEGELPVDKDVREVKNELSLSKRPPNYYDEDRIRKYFMDAVKEIKAKVDSEIKEAKEERNTLDAEIFECMKREAVKIQRMKNLPKEVQIKKLVDAVEKAASCDPNMTPEMIEELTPTVVSFYEAFLKYGK